MMVGNLRGVRESAKIFSIPTYAFIFGIVMMLFVGLIKYFSSDEMPQNSPSEMVEIEPLTIFLLLRAFSSGCTALAGVEAVSNAVPSFKDPSTKHAKSVLLTLSLLVLLLFGGVSVLAFLYNPVPNEETTVIAQIASGVFGGSFMFYYVMATTFVILVMAANTSFSGFPLLVSIMAKEVYVPKQFSIRGDRLSYSNGIVALSVIVGLLIVVFSANVTHLIGLYAVGVFISFTLSQSGMFLKWVRQRSKNWVPKAVVNGLGGLVTAIAVVIISITKFTQGAWTVVIIIPVFIYMMLKVKQC